ncbi:hypothetical protein AB3Y40_06765 [Yoonia sp. R2331]|uniref:hypothetical protein n=1 Tax=Yoonia sp. R2331 TaxID=3237238 RepID=UPI0034E586E8
MTEEDTGGEIVAEEATTGEEVTTEVVEQPTWTDEDALEARAFGWKAPDEWAGEKPPGYIDDPSRYLERIQNSRPFKVMSDRLSQEKAEAADRIRRLEAVTSSAIERQRAQHKQELEAVRANKRKAVELSDTEEYDRLEAQESALMNAAPPQDDQNPTPQLPPEVESYRNTERGAWINDPEKSAIARGIIDAGLQSSPHMTPTQQMHYAEERLAKMYPDDFPHLKPAQPARPARVDGGGLGGARSADPFTKLPPEAKQAFARFAEQGIFTDDAAGRKAYTDEYNA